MITLQNITPPEQSICTEHDLYYRAYGAVGFSQSTGQFTLSAGATLSFNSYFNLFNLEKWTAACDIGNLFIDLLGTGLVELRVVHALPQQSSEVLYCEIVTLTTDTRHRIDISDHVRRSGSGIIFFEIKALNENASFREGRFATDQIPTDLPRLAISITTFKREDQVRETVSRLRNFIVSYQFGDNLRVQVVDNGNSADIAPSDIVTPITNPNYGGAGGFARGLIEAEQAGFSHCLFMDDDASFHMENIARTYMFIALSKDRRTAVAGAMITNTQKWKMWENGAWFDGSCHPMFCGTDLRNPGMVADMEFESVRKRPETLYGGWWFFAFAIDQVKHHPFPFFVRGDDISFSLMNDFQIYTLNGVVSFQDDFSEKESAQTLYLDLRNHLVHHLVSDDLVRSPLGTARIAIRFIMRSMLRFHYDSAEAQLLSWQDMMRGPGFFDKNIDMAERRGIIGKMVKTEIWQDISHQTPAERRRITLRSRRFRHLLGKATLNGHLVPFSGLLWDRITLKIADRSVVFPAFGAARITYLNTGLDKGYTVTQSKARFFSICWRMTTTLWQFTREYQALKRQYREGYVKMTSRDYWQEKLT